MEDKKEIWFNPEFTLPDTEEMCLVTIATDNEKRRLVLPDDAHLGRPHDVPPEVKTSGFYSLRLNKWILDFPNIN
ncbi:MAG: hypothetical protein AABY22_24315, partial [Nanoarchaeota archaeon]